MASGSSSAAPGTDNGKKNGVQRAQRLRRGQTTVSIGNEIDQIILDEMRREEVQGPLIASETVFSFHTSKDILPPHQKITEPLVKSNIHQGYFDRPEVIESYRNQQQVETPEFERVDPDVVIHSPYIAELHDEQGNDDTSDAAYAKRHKKWERKEKATRLRDIERLQNKQYHLDTRIEQLASIDSTSFLALDPSYFHGTPIEEPEDRDASSITKRLLTTGVADTREGERRRGQMLTVAWKLQRRLKASLSVTQRKRNAGSTASPARRNNGAPSNPSSFTTMARSSTEDAASVYAPEELQAQFTDTSQYLEHMDTADSDYNDFGDELEVDNDNDTYVEEPTKKGKKKVPARKDGQTKKPEPSKFKARKISKPKADTPLAPIPETRDSEHTGLTFKLRMSTTRIPMSTADSKTFDARQPDIATHRVPSPPPAPVDLPPPELATIRRATEPPSFMSTTDDEEEPASYGPFPLPPPPPPLPSPLSHSHSHPHYAYAFNPNRAKESPKRRKADLPPVFDGPFPPPPPGPPTPSKRKAESQDDNIPTSPTKIPRTDPKTEADVPVAPLAEQAVRIQTRRSSVKPPSVMKRPPVRSKKSRPSTREPSPQQKTSPNEALARDATPSLHAPSLPSADLTPMADSPPPPDFEPPPDIKPPPQDPSPPPPLPSTSQAYSPPATTPAPNDRRSATRAPTGRKVDCNLIAAAKKASGRPGRSISAWGVALANSIEEDHDYEMPFLVTLDPLVKTGMKRIEREKGEGQIGLVPGLEPTPKHAKRRR